MFAKLIRRLLRFPEKHICDAHRGSIEACRQTAPADSKDEGKNQALSGCCYDVVAVTQDDSCGRAADGDPRPEIARRKEEARQSGVAEAFVNLYRRAFCYWPLRNSPHPLIADLADFNNRHKETWHPWVTFAIREEADGTIRLGIRGKEFQIRINEVSQPPDYWRGKLADLELSVEGQLVLGVRVEEVTEYSDLLHELLDHCSLEDITAYVPGPWVEEVLQMARDEEDRSERLREESEVRRAKEQAKRFGL